MLTDAIASVAEGPTTCILPLSRLAAGLRCT